MILEVKCHKLRFVSEGKILPGEMSERSADVLGESRRVPKFNEKDPHVFFVMFE